MWEYIAEWVELVCLWFLKNQTMLVTWLIIFVVYNVVIILDLLNMTSLFYLGRFEVFDESADFPSIISWHGKIRIDQTVMGQ